MRKTTFRMAINIWILGMLALAWKSFTAGFGATSLFILILCAGIVVFYKLMCKTTGVSTPNKPQLIGQPTQKDVGRYILYMKEKFPGFKVRFKSDSALMKIFNRLMFWNKNFMTNSITIVPMLRRMYVPNNFFKERRASASMSTLRHEEVHLEDSVNFFPFFSLSYILLLPIGPGFRALWEMRAYKESIRARIEYRYTDLTHYIEHVTNLFCNSTYLFMFPFRKFIEKRLKKFYTSQMVDRLRQRNK